MFPEFTMNAKKITSLNLSDEKERLERFLQSLDSHKYHRILGDAATHPFYLNPDKMYTMRELPDLLPPKTEDKAQENKRTTKK